MKLYLREDYTQHWTPSPFNPLPEADLRRVMATFKAPVSFDDLVMVARRYPVAVHNAGSYSAKARMLAKEVSERLEQINVLVKMIYVLLHDYRQMLEDDTGLVDYMGERGDQIHFLMYLHTEHFYYLAFRVQAILGNKGKDLPGVAGLKPAMKVTYIRNHLIEHTFGTYETSGVRGRIHSEYGPTILLQLSAEPYERIKHLQDQGALFNAASFRDAIYPVLARALEAIPKES